MFIELNYFYMTNKRDSVIYLVHNLHEKKEFQQNCMFCAIKLELLNFFIKSTFFQFYIFKFILRTILRKPDIFHF